MPGLSCAVCHAELDAALLHRSGEARCPFCNELVVIPLANVHEQTGATAEAMHKPAGDVLRPLPSSSCIEMVENSDERLLFYIPGIPSSRANGLGVFAIVLNGVNATLIILAVRAHLLGFGNKNPWKEFAVFVFFSIPCLAVLYVWLRVRFEKTIVLVERRQLVIQRVLLGWRRIQKYVVTADSTVALVQVWSGSRVPEHAIGISTLTGNARFGTSLPDDEKSWLLDRINLFLRPDRYALSPLGNVISRETTRRTLTPANLREDSGIIVESAGGDRLRIRYQAYPRNRTSQEPFLATLLKHVVGWGIATASFFAFVRMIGFTVGLPGIMIALIALIAFGQTIVARYATVTVDLDQDRLECRYGLGLLGIRRSIPTSKITAIELEKIVSVESSAENQESGLLGRQCSVRGVDGTRLQLTWSHPEKFAETVASLLETRLVELRQKRSHA